MRPTQYLLCCACISSLIWYLNFRADAKLNMMQSVNLSSTMKPEAGKMHVVVTGGAGFIGSHAALQLLEQGHAVTVLDNLSRGNPGAILKLASLAPPNRFRFAMVDLGDRHTLYTVLRHSSPVPQLVMHFAAVAYVAESMANPTLYYKNITAATTFLIDVMQELGIKQLVYSSTCAVYGNQEVLPITEQSVPAPINPYGDSKLLAERVIKAAAKADANFTSILLRYFNVYGSDPKGRLGEWPRPELRGHSRISGACLDAAMGLVDQVVIKGTKHPTEDGSCVRDYVHVSDLVDAHVLAMTHLANPPPVYNIGSGKPVSVKQFVAACKNVTGKDFKVVEQAEARQGDYAKVWAKIDKIQADFGWSPKYADVNVALQHAWDWRLKHPSGYVSQRQRMLRCTLLTGLASSWL